jgi:hypothetical protein
MTILESIYKETVDLEASEFLHMKREHPENIKHTEIIPPVFGKLNDFGKIRVTLRIPKYKVNLNGTK